MTVAGLSESGLLERVLPRLIGASDSLVGPGDDAALLRVPQGRVVLSIDTLTENKDFRCVRKNGHLTTGYDVGWKAAAQNLSDMNAMGARATSMLVSLTLPGDTPVSWVEGLADGMSTAIKDLGADGCGVLGGDLGSGGEIIVTVAVTGSLDGTEPVLRSGAQVGDLVCLAGTVGFAAAGLALLESNHQAGTLAPEFQKFVDIQKRPKPLLQSGPTAARLGATAMLDISDGLLRDAGRLASASLVSIELDSVAIDQLAEPLHAAAAFLHVDPFDWVLGGGEDYSLLAAFPPTIAIPKGFVEVGTVRAGTTGVIAARRTLANGGWDHF